MSAERRYLGSWTLPSGNNVDVFLTPVGLACLWDRPPSPTWPRTDIDHWQSVTFPEILRAVVAATGQRVIGVSV